MTPTSSELKNSRWERVTARIAVLHGREFFRRWRAIRDPEARQKVLRARFRHDREAFARYAFSERIYRPYNPMQRWLLRRRVAPYTERTTPSLEAYAAPRGGAKSTIGCFVEAVHSIVYGLEKFIGVVSAEERLAKSRTKDIFRAFDSPPEKFEQLYGPFEVKGGWLDFEVSVRGGPWVRVWARSFGGQVRGELYDGSRPTLFLMDDAEKPDRVRNPELRRDWMTFLSDDILEAGDARTRYILLGTVLHRDSGLARLLKDPGWDSRKWQAVLSWPDRMDLWEACGAVWQDLTLGQYRRELAYAFYLANQAEMDRGAQVLDPVAGSIYRCFEIVWTKGWRSFNRERQNDPSDPNAQVFDSSQFRRCHTEHARDGLVIVAADGRRVRLRDCRLIGRWDPAGGAPDGDYACIAVVARDSYGYAYVLDCWLKRAKPSAQLAAAWMLAEKWGQGGPFRISLESNGFQDLVAGDTFRRQRRERREQRQFYQLQIVEEASTEPKDRLLTLEPAVDAGWLQFARDLPPVLFQQFDALGTGDEDHDDGPDGVHGAYVRLGGVPVQMGQERMR